MSTPAARAALARKRRGGPSQPRSRNPTTPSPSSSTDALKSPPSLPNIPPPPPSIVSPMMRKHSGSGSAPKLDLSKLAQQQQSIPATNRGPLMMSTPKLRQTRQSSTATTFSRPTTAPQLKRKPPKPPGASSTRPKVPVALSTSTSLGSESSNRDNNLQTSGVLDTDNDEVVAVELPETRPAKWDVPDAACFRHHSSITWKPVRERKICRAATATEPSNGRIVVELSGVGLGNTDEEVRLALPNSKDGNLRYGDTVGLYSLSAKAYLGVRQESIDEQIGTSWEIHFDSQELEPWTILSGNRTLLVGPAAVSIMNKKNRSRGRLIRSSSSALVLRHEGTGGMLSFDRDIGRFHIILDSHERSNLTRHSKLGERASSIERLQEHGHFIPSEAELFIFNSTSAPPSSTTSIPEPDRPIDAIGVQTATLESHPPSKREQVLVEELLVALQGLEGSLIKWHISRRSYILLKDVFSIDSSMSNLVSLMLPIATSFRHVRTFVDEHQPGYEYGLVMQATVQMIDELLQDFVNMIAAVSDRYRASHQAGLEASLNELFVQLQEPKHTLWALERIIADIRSLKGGALLNSLRYMEAEVFAGDTAAKRILRKLSAHACKPYMAILSQWLQTGLLEDKYDEFMVERQVPKTRGSRKVDYDGDSWDDLFTIQNQHVLEDLSAKTLREKVLRTGKYWNAVQFCETGSFVSNCVLDREKVPVTPIFLHRDRIDTIEMATYIDQMFNAAARELVRLILCDFKLGDSLLTMKRFFLLDKGDFAVNFLDSAEAELSRDVDKLSRGRIQHMLSLAVQLSEFPTDDTASVSTLASQSLPATQPLTSSLLMCDFATDGLVKQLSAMLSASTGVGIPFDSSPSRLPNEKSKRLTGILTLKLDLPEIPFPTSLVISKQILGNYQLLFRHLFFSKYVERRLVGIWRDHQILKRLQELHLSMGPTYVLRQRMLHFVQNLLYYMMAEVIEPNWLDLERKLSEERTKATDGRSSSSARTTVDDIIQSHDNFLKATMDECLLTNVQLIQSLTKILKTCLLFSDEMSRFMDATRINDENEKMATFKRSRMQRSLHEFGTPVETNRKRIGETMKADQEETALRIAKQTTRVDRELSNNSYKRMIARYEEVFDSDLKQFMQKLQSQMDGKYHAHMANLMIRLDFNGFVSKRLGKET